MNLTELLSQTTFINPLKSDIIYRIFYLMETFRELFGIFLDTFFFNFYYIIYLENKLLFSDLPYLGGVEYKFRSHIVFIYFYALFLY